MAGKLEPVFDYVHESLMHEGRYRVQLDILDTGEITEAECRRVLRAASWESDDMGSMCDGYEGIRSILLKRDPPCIKDGVELRYLQVSGVGHVGFSRRENGISIFMTDGTMLPPSADNFYESFKFKNNEMGTSKGIVDGQETFEKDSYAPIGSYMESRAKLKAEKTWRACLLGIEHMVVPKPLAVGRYLDLMHEGEHLSFLVFPVPDSQRFGGCLGGKRYSVLGDAAGSLGMATRELHEKGYCHRQLHFSNFYPLDDGRLYVMDWSTMLPLEGRDIRLRAIDINIPFQSLVKVIDNELGPGPMQKKIVIFAGFMQDMLSSYLGKPIDYKEEALEALSISGSEHPQLWVPHILEKHLPE